MKGKCSINKITVNGDKYYLDDKNTSKVKKCLKKILISTVKASVYNGFKFIK